MAALQEERSYGLSCGRVGGRVSVFHVKLTDSALRAFEGYQKCQDSISSKPAIQFQGSQGQISIPRPDCPTEVRTFTFYLSNVGRDCPQGSFDCIQQYVESNGNIKLDCLGCIQDKITVCATDDSYQKARQSMAQAEEENKSRGAIVIKMGGRYGGKCSKTVKKVQVRKPAPGNSDAVPSRKRPTPVNLASAIKKSSSNISQRPFKDRIIHLLALKPYKKPELILRLQKDGLILQDKDSLDGLLQQVANQSAKDCTYTLKECLYKEVQKDWPGYSEGDQQLLKRILVRKLCQPQNVGGQADNVPLSPSKDNVNTTSPYPQKRPLQHPDSFDPSVPKKVRISHFTHRSQPTFNGKLSSSNGKDSSPPTLPPTLDSVSSSARLPPPHDPLSDSSTDTPHKDCDSQDASERLGHAAQTNCSSVTKQNCNPAHGKPKKKSKKHKERVKEKNSDKKLNCSSDKIGGTVRDVLDLNGASSNSSIQTSTSEMPDYILKYTPISSQEQRQSYKNDFNAKYSQYRDLHARIEGITSRFTELDARLKQLDLGSEEYKTIHDQILQEYHKIKKSNPDYCQEKNRCEYLHNKLAHIKKLIAQYDQQQIQSPH